MEGASTGDVEAMETMELVDGWNGSHRDGVVERVECGTAEWQLPLPEEHCSDSAAIS